MGMPCRINHVQNPAMNMISIMSAVVVLHTRGVEAAAAIVMPTSVASLTLGMVVGVLVRVTVVGVVAVLLMGKQ